MVELRAVGLLTGFGEAEIVSAVIAGVQLVTVVEAVAYAETLPAASLAQAYSVYGPYDETP